MRFLRFSFLLLFLPLLLLVVSSRVQAIPLPWYEVRLNAGSTSNVLLDSTSSSSEYAGITLNLEESLTTSLLAFYTGDLNFYTQLSDMASIYNEAGLDFVYPVSKYGDVWANGGFSKLDYGEEYSIYDRSRMSITYGLNMTYVDKFIWRVTGLNSAVNYPTYKDSLKINYNDMEFTTGINLTLPGPVVFDAEAGMLNRDYLDLQRDVNTSNTYFNFRVSAPLNEKTGVNVQLWLRDEKAASPTEKIVLYANGIDPRDLLWDGHRISGKITRFFYPWKLSAEYLTGRAEYINVQIAGVDFHRQDSYSIIDLDLSRPLPAGKHPLKIILGASYSYTNNVSNVGIYDYHSHQVKVYLNISAL